LFSAEIEADTVKKPNAKMSINTIGLHPTPLGFAWLVPLFASMNHAPDNVNFLTTVRNMLFKILPKRVKS
jgi:hypothetical protein